jgi:hypothetical protein
VLKFSPTAPTYRTTTEIVGETYKVEGTQTLPSLRVPPAVALGSEMEHILLHSCDIVIAQNVLSTYSSFQKLSFTSAVKWFYTTFVPLVATECSLTASL